MAPGQSEPGSNDNEEVLHTSQISKAGALPSNGLIPYPGHLLWGWSYSYAERSYSYASDWAARLWYIYIYIYIYIYTDVTYVHNCFHLLRAILNKSWQQHPTRHQLYGHLPPITKTIQVRRTRHAGHCWRSRDELIRDVLLWIPTHGRAKAGRPARTYIQQLCEDTGCCPEDLPRAMNDREEWRERVRDIRASSAI